MGVASREPEWTPFLNAWQGWQGTAVAASSEPQVALTSLLRGVNPWHHQRLVPGRPARAGVPALARILARAGYHSRACVPESFQHPLGDGFDELEPQLSTEDTALAAARLADGEFLWFHLSEAEIVRRRKRRGHGRQFLRHHLLAYGDPRIALPEAERAELWDTYGRGVRRLDQRLGELVEALRRSPAWQRTTLLITGSHGIEFGEHGQILYGENLGRETIEVPLFVRWPDELGSVGERPGRRVAQTRLWTTVVEIAGLEAAPVHPTSLFQASDAPILSELYALNGGNRFSLLVSPSHSQALQLLWTARFGSPEPDYYLARRVEAGARARLIEEPARRLFARLDAAFQRSLPLSGRAGQEPELTLELWTSRGNETVDDPAEARRLAVMLRRHWTRFTGRELPPGDEWGRGAEPATGGLTPARTAR